MLTLSIVKTFFFENDTDSCKGKTFKLVNSDQTLRRDQTDMENSHLRCINLRLVSLYLHVLKAVWHIFFFPLQFSDERSQTEHISSCCVGRLACHNKLNTGDSRSSRCEPEGTPAGEYWTLVSVSATDSRICSTGAGVFFFTFQHHGDIVWITAAKRKKNICTVTALVIYQKQACHHIVRLDLSRIYSRRQRNVSLQGSGICAV